MNLIEPKLLKGTRDFGPDEMAKRQYVIHTLRDTFIRHGYARLETPAIEYAETILGKYGDEADKLTYSFTDNGGREIALRYDQTVPTARFVAANWSSLSFPFKRYQIGPVWRADKPQRGRYREFVQCDIDIIGSTSLVADAEVAKIMQTVCSDLGIDPFVIRVNSRRLMDDLLELCKVKKKDRLAVIRLIDKLDKVPLHTIQEELATFLPEAQVELITDTMLSEKVRNDLHALPNTKHRQEVLDLFELYKQYGIDDEHIMLDLTLARGLDYYTGVIYEVIIPESGLGSICGGGRYDDLTTIFTDKQFPGVGVAFGLDRLMVWLEENGKLDHITAHAQVLVAQFEETKGANIATSQALVQAGIPTEFYLEPAKLQKQLKFANKKSIPFVMIQGEEEVDKNQVVLRNMQTGEQQTYSLKDAIKQLQSS